MAPTEPVTSRLVSPTPESRPRRVVYGDIVLRRGRRVADTGHTENGPCLTGVYLVGSDFYICKWSLYNGPSGDPSSDGTSLPPPGPDWPVRLR